MATMRESSRATAVSNPVMQRYNCQPCKQRKSKCDRNAPCLSCVLRGTEEYCYTENQMPPSSSSHANASDSRIPHNSQSVPFQRAAPASRKASALENTTSSPATERRPSTESSKIRADASLPDLQTGSAKTAALQSALDGMTASLSEMRKLVNTGVLRDSLSRFGPMIAPEDAEAILPPSDECREIFHCFCNDLTFHHADSQRHEDLVQLCNLVCLRREPIARHRLASLCTIIALTLLLSPQSHPASHLPKKVTTDPRWQIDNARLLLDAYYNSPTHAEEDEEDRDYGAQDIDSEDEILGQLEAESFYCYYCAAAGLFKKCWLSLGKATQLAHSINLFDESRWQPTSTAQLNYRRRVAYDLANSDRWASLIMGRAGGLTRAINVRFPESDHLMVSRRNELTVLISVVFNFVHQSSFMDLETRVQKARETEREIVACYDKHMGKETSFERLREKIAEQNQESMRIAGSVMSFYLSHLYLRCITMRPFLMDAEAPLDLRFASLRQARLIIEAMPYIVTIISSPYAPSPPAWTAQFIFCAASTFATVVLSKTESDGGATAKNGTSSHRSDSLQWPEEDIEWFASSVFDVFETFELVARGARNEMAKACKNLLVGLCTSRETLRRRYQKRERARKCEMHSNRNSRMPVDGRVSRKRALPSIFAAADAAEPRLKSQKASVPPSKPSEEQSAATFPAMASVDVAADAPISNYSAAELLASMSTPLPNTAAFTDFGYFPVNASGFDLPFLDPQEWSHLTANLQEPSPSDAAGSESSIIPATFM